MMTHIPPISRLSNSVIRILGCNPGVMTLQGTNTYLIGTGEKRTLLDTGESNVPEYISNLKDVLEEENCSVDNIILTHWHHDHLGGVLDVVKELSLAGCTLWKYRRNDIQETKSTYNFDFHFLKDKQELKTNGATLEILYTPGHTTDHIAVLLKEENALFSGDCVLGEGTTVFEDLHDYMCSLNRILSQAPSVIYPGHGPVVQKPKEWLHYYIHHRNQREKEIIKTLEKDPLKKWTDVELVKEIYKDTPEYLHEAACFNVNHHLKKLLKQHKVQQSGETWYLVSRL